MFQESGCCFFSEVGETFPWLYYVAVTDGGFTSRTYIFFRFPLLEMLDEAYTSFASFDDWTYRCSSA